ncbi:flagellar biosynthesis regulator FlaF [Albibacillus kandeliae]|uniref:flagellar biosynthesis regulator FlaF n=1 Tax=Albibacillus kandeliae TaxID=2174228 RepID=UPI000D685667|nr:flagellar biosynthesis regulator FlaF [Albibacillus kandeliae]
MNALSKARRAYSSVSTPTRTARNSEYEAVARITQKLQAAADRGPAGFTALVQALHENKKLWNIFAIEVADDRNTLPKELRARIFYLAEFTHHHTGRILARQATVEALLEVNKSVLRGLRGEAA